MLPEEKNSESTAIKNQLFFLLVALVMVSGTVTVTLYRQASLANKDITQLERVISTTQTNEMFLGSILGQLVSYGEKHPDYLPVLKKTIAFPPKNTPATGTAAPSAPRQ
jgi:hypothetical protein